MNWYLKKLSGKKQYIKNIRGYVKLSLFSLICKILREQGITLGHEDMEKHLEMEYNQDSIKGERGIKQLVDHINTHYKETHAIMLRKELVNLTPANYFKNRSLINDLLAKPIPKSIVRSTLEVLLPV